MPTASSLAWKTSLRKVRMRALQQIKERGALPMIDRGYPSGNRPLQQYLGFTAGRWLWLARCIRPDSLIAKLKRAERQMIDVWAESLRLSPLWLSASSSACHGLLIITVITPLPTKPSATKMPENCWRTRYYWHADASAWCCCAWCKIHEGVSWCQSWNDALWMMLPLVVVGCTSKQSAGGCVRRSLTASGVDNAAPPPTGRHRWTGLFHPQREADHYAKTTGRNPEVY